MKKLIIGLLLMFALTSCEFKPNTSDLINMGFKEHTVVYKKETFKMYCLKSKDNKRELQYYVDTNDWYIETAGIATTFQLKSKDDLKRLIKLGF